MKENKLWGWFELSYAGFLTLPRVLMHEMPLKWQNDMAKLLNEYDSTFNRMDDVETRVVFTKDGRFIKGPRWLCNYRYPNKSEITKLKKNCSKNRPPRNQLRRP